MKKYLLVLILLLSYFLPKAQTMTTKELQDRIAIRELIDNYCILADRKDVDKQLLLYTNAATQESHIKGADNKENVQVLKGRKQIGEAFSAFLKNFETVYHFSGQNVVTFNGDKATGIVYCMATLISDENGKKIKTTFAIHYDDEYVYENKHWLFAKRIAHFDWQDRQELGH